MAKIKIVCSVCGSDDVVRDTGYCNADSCGEERTLTELPLEQDVKVVDIPLAEPPELCRDSDLHNRTPNCAGHVISGGPGGGVKCSKCRGWFCF